MAGASLMEMVRFMQDTMCTSAGKHGQGVALCQCMTVPRSLPCPCGIGQALGALVAHERMSVATP